GGFRRYARSHRVRDRGVGRDGKALSAAARAEPALPVARAGGGFVEDVRADVAGAWAGLRPPSLRAKRSNPCQYRTRCEMDCFVAALLAMTWLKLSAIIEK